MDGWRFESSHPSVKDEDLQVARIISNLTSIRYLTVEQIMRKRGYAPFDFNLTLTVSHETGFEIEIVDRVFHWWSLLLEPLPSLRA